ncbi:hypothetical protein [Bradyrhizobium sp. RDM4]|uniref:hypothetical protein n=1 Tax=Bradyrhizobium sp. RDM4 TaxID=3378765 RepID=UPI0038FC8B30
MSIEDKGSSIGSGCRANRDVGKPAGNAGSLPGLSGSGGPHTDELTAMRCVTTTEHGRLACHQHPQRAIAALARPAEA